MHGEDILEYDKLKTNENDFSLATFSLHQWPVEDKS